jgi:hypothetical protein
VQLPSVTILLDFQKCLKSFEKGVFPKTCDCWCLILWPRCWSQGNRVWSLHVYIPRKFHVRFTCSQQCTAVQSHNEAWGKKKISNMDSVLTYILIFLIGNFDINCVFENWIKLLFIFIPEVFFFFFFFGFP